MDLITKKYLHQLWKDWLDLVDGPAYLRTSLGTYLNITSGRSLSQCATEAVLQLEKRPAHQYLKIWLKSCQKVTLKDTVANSWGKIKIYKESEHWNTSGTVKNMIIQVLIKRIQI